MASTELNCRQCGLSLSEATAIYFDSANKPTKEPVCKFCYERAVSKGLMGVDRHRDANQRYPGYQQRVYNGSWSE